jgi:superfamily II DNA/RNA helicase
LSFSQFSLSNEVLRSLRDRGHHDATPIQTAAIPIALSGKDLIATAETGSGKTAAYLLPVIERIKHLANKRPENAVQALVVVPTRELAAQVGREFSLLARNLPMRAVVIAGGDSMHRQLTELRRGAQVLVACPGRLIDHLERATVSLRQIHTLVIDEADRMLDMGFLPQLRRIVARLPRERHTMMFSATFPAPVQRIARDFLNQPEKISIGQTSAPPVSIRQRVCAVTTESKGKLLLELLRGDEVESAIVFTRTKIRADRIARLLARHNVKVVAIHGDRSQSQRNIALAGFKAGRYHVMVATDVAARGLDIPDVSHVINFDLPEEPEVYIHRIGRTARMGRAGEAISLVTPEERAGLAAIERVLGSPLQRRGIEGFEAPEISAPKPVRLFRTSGAQRLSQRTRVRQRWS